MTIRTPTKDIIKKISKILRDERPDYVYLRDLFRKIREEFSVTVSEPVAYFGMRKDKQN